MLYVLLRIMVAKGKTAWILEWSPHRDDIGMSNLRPVILPRAWGKERIKDVMRVIYWNSPLWAIFETQGEIHKSKPERLLISDSGHRIDYSDYGGTVLIGALVKDLKISHNEEGGETMEWTLPPHLSYDRDTGQKHETSQWIPRSYHG